jgi:hypothetical protein
MFKEIILQNEDFHVRVQIATTETGHSKLAGVISSDELNLIANAGAKDAMDKLNRLLLGER